MNKRGNIVLGNDYDSWYDYGIKEPITSDITPKTNTHLLLCGLSGSGKSYALLRCFREFIQAGSPQDEYYFGDFKQDDSFTQPCTNTENTRKFKALSHVPIVAQNEQKE